MQATGYSGLRVLRLIGVVPLILIAACSATVPSPSPTPSPTATTPPTSTPTVSATPRPSPTPSPPPVAGLGLSREELQAVFENFGFVWDPGMTDDETTGVGGYDPLELASVFILGDAATPDKVSLHIALPPDATEEEGALTGVYMLALLEAVFPTWPPEERGEWLFEVLSTTDVGGEVVDQRDSITLSYSVVLAPWGDLLQDLEVSSPRE